MARIVGVNAIILYANDPAALAEWYARRLGLTTTENADDGNFYGEIDDYHTGLTFQFAIFKAAPPLPPAGRGLMVTYRGRFARLHDPEGNPLELWALDPAPQVDWQHPPEA